MQYLLILSAADNQIISVLLLICLTVTKKTRGTSWSLESLVSCMCFTAANRNNEDDVGERDIHKHGEISIHLCSLMRPCEDESLADEDIFGKSNVLGVALYRRSN